MATIHDNWVRMRAAMRLAQANAGKELSKAEEGAGQLGFYSGVAAVLDVLTSASDKYEAFRQLAAWSHESGEYLKKLQAGAVRPESN